MLIRCPEPSVILFFIHLDFFSRYRTEKYGWGISFIVRIDALLKRLISGLLACIVSPLHRCCSGKPHLRSKHCGSSCEWLDGVFATESSQVKQHRRHLAARTEALNVPFKLVYK
ncbi:hypothetical protein XENOCAPTIV_004085 [Xenoophorus captivus]|uniref:Secreted protein n=1 Tax=Xenoophorus captivus TaxID=1517983 RepID=A0ABV0SE01_9TELE